MSFMQDELSAVAVRVNLHNMSASEFIAQQSKQGDKALTRILRNFAAAVAIGFALTACEMTQENRGYRLDPEMLAKVEPGVGDKDSVLEALGSPSSVSTFPDEGEAWYYISRKTEHFAFLDKKVLEQNVVVIKFDANEVVEAIKKYDKEDGKEVTIVDRTTPTGGNELGFFEQIFGNFGRFNPGAN
ncbi:MAG: outer membrane protein assembly factor BamE [Sneathiellales bacterium]|nr:outer membrane protein assembly factor BamE [Sneathiellales bacterium]